MKIPLPTEAMEAMRIQEPMAGMGDQAAMKARVLMEVQETAAGVKIPVETAVQVDPVVPAAGTILAALEGPGTLEVPVVLMTLAAMAAIMVVPGAGTILVVLEDPGTLGVPVVLIALAAMAAVMVVPEEKGEGGGGRAPSWVR